MAKSPEIKSDKQLLEQLVVGNDALAALRQLDVNELPVVESDVRLGACVGNVGKFLCIGLNYSDHAAESGMTVPSEPEVFTKTTSAICGPDDDIIQPLNSEKLDWEVELAIVIGKHTSYVSEEDAAGHIAGYCVCNDVSERLFQLEKGTPSGVGLGQKPPVYLVAGDKIKLGIDGLGTQSQTVVNLNTL